METKKVLIYRNELLPSTETFILSQTNALRRFRPIFGGLQRVNSGLELAPHPVLTLCESESWTEKVRKRAFLRTGRSRRLTQAVAAQRAQIIHAHFAVDAGAALPVAKRLQMPLIATLHGYDVTCSEETLRRWPTTRAYLRRKSGILEYATLFLCVSEHVRQSAISLGFPKHKLRIHRIGVELHDDDGHEPHRDARTVLFAGRLVEKKGCIHLIHAMSRVQKVIPEARLVVVGTRPLRDDLEREATLRCRGTLFLGHQSGVAVKQWMQRARVLAAPSIKARNGDSEGLPTVLCEAQAEGLPVITFATGGVTEALPADRHGSLPKTGDVENLAGEIIRLMTDDQAWCRASDAGKKFMKSYFDLAVQTQILEDIYDEVIARHRV